MSSEEDPPFALALVLVSHRQSRQKLSQKPTSPPYNLIPPPWIYCKYVRFHHDLIACPDGTRLLTTGGRSPLPWPSSNSPPFSTTTPNYNVDETSPPGHTFHIDTKAWTPDGRDLYLADSDACRGQSSVPGATPFVLSRYGKTRTYTCTV